MDKILFEKYAANRAEIDRLKRDDCTLTDVVRGSSPEPPYTAHSIRVTGVDAERYNHNQERIKKLEADCSVVEAAIAVAPGIIADALILKYSGGEMWKNIGQVLNMHPDTIRKQVEKYISNA